MVEVLRFRRAHFDQMLEHVQRALPEEACGLVGGRHGAASWIIPVANVLHSPEHFRMDPREQVDAMLQLEKRKLDLLAIYHSHPSGPGQPSATDLLEHAYPHAALLIWWMANGRWQVSGFDMQSEQHYITVRLDWLDLA